MMRVGKRMVKSCAAQIMKGPTQGAHKIVLSGGMDEGMMMRCGTKYIINQGSRVVIVNSRRNYMSRSKGRLVFKIKAIGGRNVFAIRTSYPFKQMLAWNTRNNYVMRMKENYRSSRGQWMYDTRTRTIRSRFIRSRMITRANNGYLVMATYNPRNYSQKWKIRGRRLSTAFSRCIGTTPYNSIAIAGSCGKEAKITIVPIPTSVYSAWVAKNQWRKVNGVWIKTRTYTEDADDDLSINMVAQEVTPAPKEEGISTTVIVIVGILGLLVVGFAIKKCRDGKKCEEEEEGGSSSALLFDASKDDEFN